MTRFQKALKSFNEGNMFLFRGVGFKRADVGELYRMQKKITMRADHFQNRKTVLGKKGI